MKLLRLAALAAAPVLAVGAIAPAWADDVYNDLDDTVDATVETMTLTAGGSTGTTTFYVAPKNNDGKSGCNLNQNEGQTLTVAVISSDPLVATVSPATFTLLGCGPTTALTVHPLTEGTTQVRLRVLVNTTGASFNLSGATFDVGVGPANTAPVVSISGVDDGGSYDKGSVPTATCDVLDTEDGAIASFPATLSAVTGTYGADGIGSQTATCSYTDLGGLLDDASVSYQIVDPSAPNVAYDLTPATPDGDNGWWTSGVDVDWTVNDDESPSSLSTTDCDDFSLTADQAAASYTCTADSAGGHSENTTPDIKIDGTDPTLDVTGGPAAGARYYFGLDPVPAAPECTADDALSGVNADGCVVSGWSDQIGEHTVTATATDNAGNSDSWDRSYTVLECNLETSEIGTSCQPKCNNVVATIKGEAGGPIVGTLGDDVIVGTLGDDQIDGLGGNDTICGLDGDDTIDGSDGADVVLGGTGTDTVNGGEGNDIVRAGSDDDVVNGDAGNDTLKGEPGNDTLNGGDGNDNMFGLVGNDTLNGDAGDDRLTGMSGADVLDGGDGNDNIGAGVGNDSADGGAGADTINGAEGLDTIVGGDGDDLVTAGPHADNVHGGAGADTLNGGFGDDHLWGEADNDTLNGNEGADWLYGGDGDDRLIGGPDVDVLDGGLGVNYLFS